MRLDVDSTGSYTSKSEYQFSPRFFCAYPEEVNAEKQQNIILTSNTLFMKNKILHLFGLLLSLSICYSISAQQKLNVQKKNGEYFSVNLSDVQRLDFRSNPTGTALPHRDTIVKKDTITIIKRDTIYIQKPSNQVHSSYVPVQLKLSPMPVTTVLNVECEQTMDEIILLDMQGVVILNTFPRAKTTQLLMSYLASGFYILQVKTVNGIQSQKVIKN